MEQKKVNVQMLEPQPTNGIRTIDTTSSRIIAKPHVSGSFKHSILDVWAFAEWTGQHYIRLHECWAHRLADQRNKDNWKDTGELWALWWENYR